jgi:hypothetical protein
MLEKELEKKVETFLKENKRKYYENSINYVGLRDTKLKDGSFKKLHVVSYMVFISNQPYDGDAFFSMTFDEKTLKKVFLIGPQSIEEFEE